MLTTLSGMRIDVRSEQQRKALSPMLFTLSGMCIDVRQTQKPKVYAPILFTPSGICIDVRAVHLQYLQPVVSKFVMI